MKPVSGVAGAVLLASTSIHGVPSSQETPHYANEYCRLEGMRAAVTIQRGEVDRDAYIPAFDGRVLYSDVRSDRDDEGRSPGTRDLVIRVLEETGRTARSFNDGCWEGQTGKFVRTVRIERISSRARGVLGLREGSATRLSCRYESLSAVGRDCPH